MPKLTLKPDQSILHMWLACHTDRSASEPATASHDRGTHISHSPNTCHLAPEHTHTATHQARRTPSHPQTHQAHQSHNSTPTTPQKQTPQISKPTHVLDEDVQHARLVQLSQPPRHLTRVTRVKVFLQSCNRGRLERRHAVGRTAPVGGRRPVDRACRGSNPRPHVF